MVRVHGSESVAVHRAPELCGDELGELVAAHRAPAQSGDELAAVTVSAVGLRLMQNAVLRQRTAVSMLWLFPAEERSLSLRRIPLSQRNLI